MVTLELCVAHWCNCTFGKLEGLALPVVVSGIHTTLQAMGGGEPSKGRREGKGRGVIEKREGGGKEIT